MANIDYNLDRGLPASPDAEKAILGAVILESNLWYEAVTNLRTEHFYLGAHRMIYGAMAVVMDEGKPLDTLTLAEELGCQKALEACGGVAYLSQLTDGVPRRASIEHYVKIVIDKYKLRSLIHGCNGIIANAVEASDPANEIVADAATVIGDICDDTNSNDDGPRHISEFVKDLREYNIAIEKLDLGVSIGLPIGIVSVDSLTGGLRPAELTTIGGYTGDGKTAFIDGIILECGIRKTPSALFSVEMKGISITMRLAAHLAEIDFRHIQDIRDMTNVFEKQSYQKALTMIEEMPIFIDESNIEIDDLMLRTRMLKRKENIQMMALDYVQITKVDGAKDGREKVDKISYSNRDLAKSENIHIIQLSQLSRPEGREKRPPKLMDLKESSGLEQSSHNVWFTYREQDKDDRYTGANFLIVAKNRNGATGKASLEFTGPTMRWSDPKPEDN